MFSNRTGETVPNVTFQLCEKPIPLYNQSDNQHTQTTTTDELFTHKKIIAFAVPGAFTYPYSTIQLLGYNSYYDLFRANGIDDIICISVNNCFVLSHWVHKAGASHIRLLPDTQGEFTDKMGMLMNFAEQGMGPRSWRYSMLVNNKVIEKMFIESASLEAWPEVSNAETMLNYINPTAVKPKETVALMQMWRAMLSA